MRESFDSDELPPLFTEGRGDWKIVDGYLRGQQLAVLFSALKPKR